MGDMQIFCVRAAFLREVLGGSHISDHVVGFVSHIKGCERELKLAEWLLMCSAVLVFGGWAYS